MIEYENLARLNQPFFAEYKKSFAATLDSGWYILGKNVEKFENEFAGFCGAKYCIGVASGLDALILSLAAFEFEKGDEVIVPSNTYIATILAILQNGLKPVLVEPDIKTYNINPNKIAEKITNKTCAIIVVHLYGKCCEMAPIMDLCRKNNLKLIEDSAQAHGAKYRGKMAGTFGDFGAFSFYPTKNLGALGDAGAIVTDHEKLVEKIKTLRNYGSKVKYYNELIGYNSRLDEVQAGFLSIKLSKLFAINEHKNKLAKIYFENLKSDFIKPVRHPDYFDVFHIFNIRHPQRNLLKQFLLDHGIKTEIHYPLSPNKQKAMAEILSNQPCPISEEIHATTLSLPISYFHTKEDVERVCEVMNRF
ncbi:MAG: aminotransferase [Alphaproteobacteria bacterium RIFCSPLOWO2_01_FULL_40_26]|nr:MAG: aminotransferase [Alphaproteobacteria bacterium RIFCSPHIGHO2_02_FULL_40_34]OFW95198.1 MAG: aminotransferase [Alphaproteobacteria bacterium RIFCSPLOWO2_01_FULL_40_26]OFX09967.1 MAG: aminotransferase [Alphaproteobacteria bacterium RIFCSPLOWO2_02_FULL_40_19]OFX12339.1 MAG: aminotransferase [Alphaproteobacteria bacterium RIFCSPLOWO2_12_FULL_40_11]